MKYAIKDWGKPGMPIRFDSLSLSQIASLKGRINITESKKKRYPLSNFSTTPNEKVEKSWRFEFSRSEKECHIMPS
jgi:hypothetical protein